MQVQLGALDAAQVVDGEFNEAKGRAGLTVRKWQLRANSRTRGSSRDCNARQCNAKDGIAARADRGKRALTRAVTSELYPYPNS
jgi:hypothetical protein